MSALDQLISHFSLIQPKEIKIKGLDEIFYMSPLNIEDHVLIAATAEEKDNKKRAEGFARIVYEKVRNSDGNRAFESKAGERDSLRKLIKEVDPSVIWEIIAQINDGSVDTATVKK